MSSTSVVFKVGGPSYVAGPSFDHQGPSGGSVANMDPHHDNADDEAPPTSEANKDKTAFKYVTDIAPILQATRRRQLRDETHSQTAAEAHSIQIPHLHDETPSQSDDVPPPPIVPASTKKTARASTPYREPPSTATIETHAVRLNKRQPSTSSSLHVTGVASRIRMRRSSRLQGGASQQSSSSRKVVIDLTAPEAGHGVRCSWGPPGRGGIQFMVLDVAPPGLGASKKGKAPAT
ncbi:hypothetical protein CJ030_MR4G003033 [Morella rubra]|uniref:Uncharacterized protein n=1 Tax=Morella rubra TaxID=262757 RepID=A0A6A1VS85_9ROSI|nr:hypothetical protein CJ030_MR4G003033 [Morella rubra]